MSWKEHFRKTFELAYPVCLSQMGHILVGVADTAMVGMIGTKEQAAVALANSVYSIILVLGIGISYGITPLVAASDGSGDYLKSTSYFKNGLVINFITGLLLFGVLYFASPLLLLLDQPTEVSAMAIPFFNVMVFSMVPLSIYFSFKQFAEGLSDTKAAMIVSIGANVLNIILNYVMIFGKLGFPEMGLMGSCWASFISRVVMAIAMFVYLKWKTEYKVYWNNWKLARTEWSVCLNILNLGIPSGLQFLFEVGAFAFAAIMIGWIGAVDLAANQITLSMAALTYMMASGISAAASVRVGNQFGAKDLFELRRSAVSAIYMVVVIMSCSALIFFAFRNILPTYFSKEADVIAIASGLMVIAGLFQLSDGLQAVALGVLRGLQDVRIPTGITLLAYWIIALPLSYFLAFTKGMGVNGVWWGLSIGLTCAAIMLILRFNYVSRRVFEKDHPSIT